MIATMPVDGIAFLESYLLPLQYPFVSETLRQFIPFAQSCMARAVRFSTTTRGLGLNCCSLTLGEAFVVTRSNCIHCCWRH